MSTYLTVFTATGVPYYVISKTHFKTGLRDKYGVKELT